MYDSYTTLTEGYTKRARTLRRTREFGRERLKRRQCRECMQLWNWRNE